LVHNVLEQIEFNSGNLNAEIAAWCEHLAPQYVVQNTNEAVRLAAEMISRFAHSPRAQQLAAAKSLHRETEFLLAWPPTDKYFTGKIDCLYQDSQGAWRIVDYKTNDISPREVERVARQYEMQLYVYAMAAEKSLGVSPTELVLQLLRPGVEHVIPWNDAVRKRAVEMVNEAIESALRNPIPTLTSDL
jgi:ATP-dependent helicase/nuclease subunit A